MFICEKILTTSGKKITSNPYKTTPHLKLMTGYDLSLRPYHFKDKHNLLSDPTCNKNYHICIL
jgi:hypothetical protein